MTDFPLLVLPYLCGAALAPLALIVGWDLVVRIISG